MVSILSCIVEIFGNYTKDEICKGDDFILVCKLGEKDKKTIHGMSHSRIYQCWADIKQRCLNPNNQSYHNYGDRGITICEEWKDDFMSFYNWAINNGYNDTLTIDRIDVNGNYCPENCRWATMKTQANNRRTNHYIEIDGETRTLEEWISLYGISKNTVMTRMTRGWEDDALFNELVNQERLIEINGETKTLNEWSAISGIPKQNIIERLFRGESGERLLRPVKQRKLNFEIAKQIRDYYLSHNEMTYNELAKKFNIKSSSTISYILNNEMYYDLNYKPKTKRKNK